MKQTHKIRAVFGGGFAVLLGVGIAAVFQTFVWESSVTQVAKTYEALSRLDNIAYSSKAAEAAALRYSSTPDTRAAAECRADLAEVRLHLAGLKAASGEGPAIQNLSSRLAELLDEQYLGILSVLEQGRRGQG